MIPTPDRQHYRITLAVLALGGTAFALLQSLVAPALPEIQHSLHTSESGVTWVLTAFLLSASVATPLVGRIGDIHGKEHVLVASLARSWIQCRRSTASAATISSLEAKAR